MDFDSIYQSVGNFFSGDGGEGGNDLYICCHQVES